ncbi:P-type conjugative transfer ATPase TrbB, partial [Xanthomonas citri pv. citri]|nr:P-type conjugative transfer ATPase TrbB [Xanthomonas citri pv. citri]
MQEEENHASVNARAIEKLRRDLGPVVMAALNDPKTVEVLLNPDGTLWQERLGERMCQIGTMTPQRAEAVVKTVAGYHGKT